MEAKTQKAQSGLSWVLQDGQTVDKSRLFPYEVKGEKAAIKLFNMALKIQEGLKALVEEAESQIEDVRQSYLKHKGPEKLEDDNQDKGFTFYSFNRDIKIEKIVIVTPGYKEEDVALSKGYFEDYINQFAVDSEVDISVLKSLVLSAFTTKRGKFDNKKLDQLLSYDNITDETFQKAISLLKEARFNNKPKTYYNIYFRDEEGVYVPVNLKVSGV